MQMVDEFRHSTIQMNLKKWYMENYIDPAGFDITEEAFGKCYATTIGRQFGEGFITGDAITAASIYLTVVAETAFTNTLFVAMPSEAARNGDYALPTVFLSVQSDESRHIGNGHSLLMAALKDPENHLLLERDLRYAFWQNHAIVDAAIGTFIEYGTTNRDKNKESYAEMWHRWILRGLLPHLHAAAREVRRQGPSRRRPRGLEPHRQEALRPQGGAVLRGRLAGQLLAHRGPDATRTSSGSSTSIRAGTPSSATSGSGTTSSASPARRYILFNARRRLRLSAPLLELHGALPDPRGHRVPTRSTARSTPIARRAAAGRTWRRSPPSTRAAPTPAMGRFSGKREWETCYHGWDLADAIKDLGFVRSDGKTLVPQPHLRFDDKDMWTLDDVRGHTLLSPLTLLRALTPEARDASASPNTARASPSTPATDANGGGRVRPPPVSYRRGDLTRRRRDTAVLDVEANAARG